MDIETIRRAAESPSLAGPADLEGVAADLADAFTDDPAFDWFLRDDAKRAAAFLRFFRFIVSTAASQGVRIERPACGGAAAVWMPFEALGPLPLGVELRAFPVLLGATGLARFGTEQHPLLAEVLNIAQLTRFEILAIADKEPTIGDWQRTSFDRHAAGAPRLRRGDIVQHTAHDSLPFVT